MAVYTYMYFTVISSFVICSHFDCSLNDRHYCLVQLCQRKFKILLSQLLFSQVFIHEQIHTCTYTNCCSVLDVHVFSL